MEGTSRPRGISSLALHLHPRSVPADALPLPRTFGLGGASLVLFLLLAGTGALLLAVYEPSPERAHGSILRLLDEVRFGALVRNAHHWAANALVLVSVLHLLRVLFRGAFLPPRRGNWLVGVALLLLVVASAFTGYLLPWDQLAYWAVTVGTGMLAYVPVAGEALLRAARGGADVGPATLSRFFVLHVAVLPAALLALLAVHFWLVRKAGGVLVPRDAGGASHRSPPVPTSPALTGREGVAALVVMAAVALASALLDAPLLAPANPGASPNPARAPWYFAGLQELLVHLHPLFGAALVPAVLLALLAALPWIAGREPGTGRWFESPRGARRVLLAFLLGALGAAAVVLASEALRHGPARLATLPAAVRAGLLPSLAFAAALAGGAFLARRRGASRMEATQAASAVLVGVLLVLTVTGAAFRGPGMALVLPGAPPAAAPTPAQQKVAP
jgi:quinol-cytochrome oxidoreductase complex cytochrome b subunit